MKPISGKAMCKALEGRGWFFVRQTASHHIYKNSNSPAAISVPVHGNQVLATGTQRAIMRQAGLTDADLTR